MESSEPKPSFEELRKKEKEKIKEIWKDSRKYKSKLSKTHELANAITTNKINIYRNIDLLSEKAIQDSNSELLLFFLKRIVSSQSNLASPVLSQAYFHKITLKVIKAGFNNVLDYLIENHADLSDSKFIAQAVLSQNCEMIQKLKDNGAQTIDENTLKFLFEEIISKNSSANSESIEIYRQNLDRYEKELKIAKDNDMRRKLWETKQQIKTVLEKIDVLTQNSLKDDNFFLDQSFCERVEQILKIKAPEIVMKSEEKATEIIMESEEKVTADTDLINLDLKSVISDLTDDDLSDVSNHYDKDESNTKKETPETKLEKAEYKKIYIPNIDLEK